MARNHWLFRHLYNVFLITNISMYSLNTSNFHLKWVEGRGGKGGGRLAGL